MKKIYLDLWSLSEEKDLNYWLETFEFPLSYSFYSKIQNDIEEIFDRVIDTYFDEEISDVLLIQYKFVLLLSNILYSWLIYQRMEDDKEREFVFSQKHIFYSFLERKNNFSDESVEQLIKPFPRLYNVEAVDLTLKDRLKLNGKRIKYWFRCNFPQVLFHPNIESKTVTVWPQEVMLNYFKRNNLVVYPQFPEDYLGQKMLSAVSEDTGKIEELVDLIIKEFRILAKEKYFCNISEHFYSVLKKLIGDNLNYILRLYRLVKKEVARKKIKRFFRLSGGNSFMQMLGLAVIKNGGESIGFQHGHPILHDLSLYRWVEFSTVSKFNFYSLGSAEIAKSLLKKYPLYRKQKIEFGSVESEHFINFYKKRPIGRKCKINPSVMFIGECYRNSLVVFWDSIIALELESRIIKELKNIGFRVLYKPHPEGIYKTGVIKKIFNKLNIEIVDGTFEDVMDMTDIYFFTSICTTAIGYAITSNKPIVALRIPLEQVLPGQRELLEKRIIFVDTFEDDRGRVFFDIQELKDAFNMAITENIDHSFFWNYMVPQNLK
jgi:hypothetical protein